LAHLLRDTLDSTMSTSFRRKHRAHQATESRQSQAHHRNPPYNVGQQNENDNNKNRKYKAMDTRIRETLCQSLQSHQQKRLERPLRQVLSLGDRAAGQRRRHRLFCEQQLVRGRQRARRHEAALSERLPSQFITVDLHGNVRRNPNSAARRTTSFGIQVGVGITILVRNSRIPNASSNIIACPKPGARSKSWRG
jgi:predicted helicase